jgi:hypothetical protein
MTHVVTIHEMNFPFLARADNQVRMVCAAHFESGNNNGPPDPRSVSARCQAGLIVGSEIIGHLQSVGGGKLDMKLSP